MKNTGKFTIVNKRIIVKTGIIRRKTLDISLGKIESVSIEQSIWGHSITFTGTKDVNHNK
ncbi:MAG: PH domain-containing protein [Prevotellaceae bacterium]|jgi:uncharacterized membrane protein YdbT with pleckstrin-like domain|nr:PH domain-containing protein [Prevotellaceae bacterium]